MLYVVGYTSHHITLALIERILVFRICLKPFSSSTYIWLSKSGSTARVWSEVETNINCKSDIKYRYNIEYRSKSSGILSWINFWLYKIVRMSL